MALQGTLETFSVPEVLRLLSGTKKTGLLALEGDRGTGRVWFDDGRLTDASSDHEQGDKLEAVLFDLLRYDSGSFVFESGARPDSDTDHHADVEEILAEAEELLVEWRAIEAVVPSLDVHVRLVEEITTESVTVTAGQWKTLAAIGGGVTARRLGADLDLGEFDACSLVRDLVEADLVQISDVAPEPEPTPQPEPLSIPHDDIASTVDHDLSSDEVASLGQNLAGFVARPAEEPAQPGAHELAEETIDLDVIEDDETLDLPVADTPDGDIDEDVDGDMDVEAAEDIGVEAAADVAPDTDDFLSQLSSLSPKAAAAIEATAEGDEPATAGDEPVGAGDRGDAVDSDEEINRNLLLKFLSSAKN